MEIRIEKLTPQHAEHYASFFDITPHDRNVDEEKCYCVCWAADDFTGKDFSSREKRRELAVQYVKNNIIQGYLAFDGQRIVGWCNANDKYACLKCVAWKMFMDYVPLENGSLGVRAKSVYCYVISPEYKRQGIATMLLNRVCQDAMKEHYDYVEAYPYKGTGFQSSDFGGYPEMYFKAGFSVVKESEKGLVMRKALK